MPAKVDLTGKRFGRLVALEPTIKRQGGNVVWKCRCDCGLEHFAPADNLGTGNTKSCGCLQKEIMVKRGRGRIINLTGQRFGRLVVMKRTSNTPGESSAWECKCDCGSMTIVRRCSLIPGNTKSCGCLAVAETWSRGTSINPMDVPFEVTTLMKTRRELKRVIKQAV